MKTIFYTLLLALALSGCNNHNSESTEGVEVIEEVKYKALEVPEEGVYYSAYDSTAVDAAAMEAPMADTDVSELPPPPPVEGSTNDASIIQPKIIKNANLRFQTNDIDSTTAIVQVLIEKYKGNIQSDVQEHEDYQMSRNMSLRIPSASFDAFIADLSKGVDYYDTKEISSQDVTEEYVDVAARIKTKKELENRYYELLKKANKVSEMLEIEQKLSEIREEIEAKQGRLKYLQTKVSMSTVDLYFYKEIARGTAKRQSYGGKIVASLGTGFNSISDFFLSVLDNWPLILIFVIAIILIRKKLKKRKKNVQET
ncbi:DUF4349 domain-containing protein [Flavobacterium sp. RHBU_3]|uniref:DUF4349 domain-containing protein n=1 Tax=Flavobacterium sp. RHBU_3 TaxID=3391184 RepID=UPI003984682C